MSFVTLRLGAEDAARVWENAVRYLAPAIARSGGLYEPEDVRARVTDPNSGWHLWMMVTEEPIELVAAWTTQLKIFPHAKLLDVPFAGGRDMESWYELALENTKDFAREIGCRGLRCGGRKGWAKYGWEKAGTLFQMKV